MTKSLAEIVLELDAEIEARKSLLTQMVGNLYPGIVQEEIHKLQAAKTCLQINRG